MKCPKCGSYNKPEYKKCYVCSTVLEQADISDDTAIHSLWSDPPQSSDMPDNVDDENYSFDVDLSQDVASQVKKERKNYSSHARRERAKEHGIWGGSRKPKHGYRGEGGIPIVALEDESHIDEPKRKRRGSKYARAALSKNAEKMVRYHEGQEVGVVIPPEPPKPKKKINIVVKPRSKKKPNEKYNIKWVRLIIACLIMAGLIFGIIVGLNYLVKSISTSMSQIFVPRNQLPNDGQPMIERVLKKGQTWHRVTFYGEDGDKILVEDDSHNIKRTLTIQDKQAVLELDDYSYIPLSDEQYYDSPFAYIDLQAWHFDQEGNETELVVPEYRISIPLAPLTIIHPTEQSTVVDATQVLVKVKVDQGSRVILGKKNMSGNIDTDGYTSTYVNIEPGQNSITVQIEKDGYRANIYSLLVDCPERSIYMEYTNAPTEERTEDIRIDGKTEPGATLTTDANLLIDYIPVYGNGEFYIKIRLNKFGWNEVNLYATTADGRTAKMTHNIFRVPFEGEYTRSAWPLDYKSLTASPERLEGQVFVLEGTVVERIDTPEARIFLFNAGTDAEPKMLMIQYNGLNDLKDDIRYDAYADVKGKFDNYPYLHARYIYVSADQDGDGVPDDQPEGEESE